MTNPPPSFAPPLRVVASPLFAVPSAGRAWTWRLGQNGGRKGGPRSSSGRVTTLTPHRGSRPSLGNLGHVRERQQADVVAPRQDDRHRCPTEQRRGRPLTWLPVPCTAVMVVVTSESNVMGVNRALVQIHQVFVVVSNK